jgi:hypothetical protein
MTVKDVLVADLQQTLEETANILADRLILESLAKHGKITLEEAEFYDSLVRRVITEAADEFVPDELVITESEEAPEGTMIVTDQEGNVYELNMASCTLNKIEGTGESDNPSLDDMGEGAEIEEEPEMQESTQETGELTESTEAGEAEQQELTESQLIVKNLIKSLGA